MHEKNQKLSHRLESKFKKKKKDYIYIFLCARVIPFPHREFLRQLRTVVIWSCEVQFPFSTHPPCTSLNHHYYGSHLRSLPMTEKTYFFGCVCVCVSCGCASQREGAALRLPGTTAVPLWAHVGSFGLQHVYLLLPLLLFFLDVSACVHACMCACINVWNKYVCKDC